MTGDLGEHPAVGRNPVSDLDEESFNEFHTPSTVRLYGRPAAPGGVIGLERLVSLVAEETEGSRALDALMDLLYAVNSGDTAKTWNEAAKKVFGVELKSELIDKIKSARGAVLPEADDESDENDNESNKKRLRTFELTIVNRSRKSKKSVDGNRGKRKRIPQILYMNTNPEIFEDVESLGVIYGYSFEGHCYTLPKPKIMFLPVAPKRIKNSDCGYSPELGYAVWVVEKRKRCVALDMQNDEIEKIILDENLPGKRSPMTYAQNMSLAPQRIRD